MKSQLEFFEAKMALVSYGSSDESDLSENEDEIKKDNLKESEDLRVNQSISNTENSSSKVCDAISDEEDLFTNQTDDASSSIFHDTGGTATASNSLFSSLPSQQNQNIANGSENLQKRNVHADENEDLSTIPEHKVYKGATLELKPKKKDQLSSQSSKFPNKNLKKAPVRILAPSLLSDRDLEDNGPPRKIIAASKKSGLLGLLPKPKGQATPANNSSISAPSSNKPTAKESTLPKTNNNPFVPRSVSRKPAPSSSKNGTTAKNQVSKKNVNESDDDSDSEPTSFFTLEDKPFLPSSVQETSTSIDSLKDTFKIQPNVHSYDQSDNDQGHSQNNSVSSYQNYTEDAKYTNNEAIAPYPPVGPSLPPSQDLMDNTEALERLAGRVRKGRGGQNKIAGREMIPDNIIEVNQGDLTADPNEWMTKALTQDDNAPGPRCNIGGQTKRKHQLTYLAAMAKQNENELKKQWAENSQSRRAHQSKYGF